MDRRTRRQAVVFCGGGIRHLPRRHGGTKGDADYLRQFIKDQGNHVRAWMDKLDIEKHYVAKDGLQQIDVLKKKPSTVRGMSQTE